MLTHAEINSLPYSNVTISDAKIFANYQILEINNRFYSAHSNRIFPTGAYNQQLRLYSTAENLILLDMQSGTFARLVPADIIKSYVQDFDGFDRGKKFVLNNGQVWEQTSGLSSNCSPGGDVWIADHQVIRVANWDFDVAVKQVK